MTSFNVICVVHHSTLRDARGLGEEIAAKYADGRDWWLATEETLAEDSSEAKLRETDLIITIGGDGTILRGAHAAGPFDIPVLGVNMGRVGFMSEVDASDAAEGIGWYLDGNGHLDERTMLRAELSGHDEEPLHALNDVTVFRGGDLRVVEVAAVVDGIELSTYRGDGVIVSTATGSTGYSLQLGGPVIDPSSSVYLLKPIAVHMSQFGGVVLESSSVLDLTLATSSSAQLTVDGFVSRSIHQGDSVRIAMGDRRARFLRREPRNAFWKGLSDRLGMRIGAMERSRSSGKSDG